MIDDKENLLRRIEKLIDVHRIYIYDHKKKHIRFKRSP